MSPRRRPSRVAVLALAALVAFGGLSVVRPGAPTASRTPSLVPAALRSPLVAPRPALLPTSNWTSLTNLSGTTAPPARAFAALTFDAALNVALLFGGEGASGAALNDTWTYGSNWSWVEPPEAVAPAARWGAAVAYDAALGAAVLFGGTNTSGGYLGDTWSFGSAGWSRIAPGASPSPRAFAALAPDPNGSGLVLFGGLGASGPLNDTWWFDGSAWENVTALVPGAPSPRWSAAFTPDPAGSFDLLFGGNSSGGPLGDTWSFTGSAWNRLAVLTPPVPRAAGVLAYDAIDRLPVLYGGWASGLGPLVGASVFNGTGWISASLAAPRPPARFGAAFVELGGFGEGLALLFGGIGNGGAVYPGSWAYASRMPLIVGPVSGPSGAIDPGIPVSLGADVLGGTPPYTYHWSDLPDGCLSLDELPLPCTPENPTTVAVDFTPRLVVADANGNLSYSANASLLVNAPLRVVQLVLYPATVAPGANLTVQAILSGGARPVLLQYSGLPAGCVSENASEFTCRANATGTFRVTVEATDPFGLSAEANASVSVTTGASGPSAVPFEAVAGLLLAAVIVLAAVWLRGRRRARSGAPPAAGPTP